MQTRHFWITAALLVMAGSVAADAPAPQVPATDAAAYTLRYKWTAGESLAYQFTMDANGVITHGADGQPFPIAQHMDAVLRQMVANVRASDGAATIKMSFDSMKMAMNGNDVTFTPEQLAKMETMGSIVMLPDGKVISFKPAPTQLQMMPGMNSMMFQSNGSLPDGPVKIGGVWKTSVAVAMVGCQMNAVNKLIAVITASESSNADIKTTVAGTFSPTAQTGAALPMDIAGTMTGSSEQTFDINAGKMKSQNGAVDIDITMTPKQAAGGTPTPTTGSMKMKMTLKTKMTLLPSAPAAPTP